MQGGRSSATVFPANMAECPSYAEKQTPNCPAPCTGIPVSNGIGIRPTGLQWYFFARRLGFGQTFDHRNKRSSDVQDQILEVHICRSPVKASSSIIVWSGSGNSLRIATSVSAGAKIDRITPQKRRDAAEEN
jgi:hypothetical protein